MMIAREPSVKGTAQRRPAKGKKEDKAPAGAEPFFNSFNQAYGQMAAAAPAQSAAQTAIQSAVQAAAEQASQAGTAGQAESMAMGTAAQAMTAIAGMGELPLEAVRGFFTAAQKPGGQLRAAAGIMEAAGAKSAETAAGVPGAVQQQAVGAEQSALAGNGVKDFKILPKTAAPVTASLKEEQADTSPQPGAAAKQEGAKAKGGPVGAWQAQQVSVKAADLKTGKRQEEKDRDGIPFLQKGPALADTGEKPVLRIKVAEPYHQMNPDFSEKLSGNLSQQLKAGNTQYQIKLDPEHLGSVEVRISVSEGRAVVELSCASHKTAELLSQNARAIGVLMEQHSQSQVSVEVRQNEESQWHEEQNGQGRDQGRDQEQQEHSDRERQEQGENSSFGEQLRLGLLTV